MNENQVNLPAPAGRVAYEHAEGMSDIIKLLRDSEPTISSRTDDDTLDGIVTLRFAHSGAARDFHDALEAAISQYPSLVPASNPPPAPTQPAELPKKDYTNPAPREAEERAWKPIETAPRDGTKFLAYYPSGDMHVIEATETDPVPMFIHRGGCRPVYWRPIKPPAALQPPAANEAVSQAAFAEQKTKGG